VSRTMALIGETSITKLSRDSIFER
jgi:hypothetical protein